MATWERVDPDTYNRLIIIKKLLRDEERLLDFLFDPLKAELRASASELLMQMGCFFFWREDTASSVFRYLVRGRAHGFE